MESSKPLANKTVVVTGGTGSLGKVLTQRIMNGEMGLPNKVVIFSRDEAKQHAMRLHYKQREAATEEIIYRNAKDRIEFVIGDVRDYHSVVEVLRNADIVFNAAAMKQVPTCEYFPMEAVRTNVGGAESIVRAIREHSLPVDTVVGVSTDKAAKPVNVMGMTKALQERVLITANLTCKKTRFVCVRYGNVIASRGSVVPLFIEQINAGGPVTITTDKMTRFLLTLDQAVDTVFAAVRGALPGETYIPKVPAVRMKDLAKAMIGNKKIKIEVIGIRPGEKEHEILISEEERFRAVDRGNYYAIQPILPELRPVATKTAALKGEYSSETELLDYKAVQALVKRERLLERGGELAEGELLV